MGSWNAINTEEKFARARLFTSIYNDELVRLKKEYGENAKGTISYRQIKSDLSDTISIKSIAEKSIGSSLDLQV